MQLNILRVPARDVPVPARYGDELSGLRVHAVAPRLVARLWRGFWHRMGWKYLLGFGMGLVVLAQTLGPPVATPGTVIASVAPALTGIHLLVMVPYLDIQEGDE